MTSVFTEIINRQLPGRIVYEDDISIVLLPNGYFINPGHLLVIPKVEVDHIFDLDDDTYLHIWRIAKRLAKPLQQITAAKRIGIAVEGFTVPHVHIHVCPLYNPAELDPLRSEDWSEQERDQFVISFKELLAGI